MTLSPKLGVVEISTLWHFRLPLPIQMLIKVASSPRLSGIGMPSPILWSHPLKMQRRIVLLSSLLWWELGTNSLITGPGEWLSFRRFTSKLSWSWSWSGWRMFFSSLRYHNCIWSTDQKKKGFVPLNLLERQWIITFVLLTCAYFISFHFRFPSLCIYILLRIKVGGGTIEDWQLWEQ